MYGGKRPVSKSVPSSAHPPQPRRSSSTETPESSRGTSPLAGEAGATVKKSRVAPLAAAPVSVDVNNGGNQGENGRSFVFNSFCQFYCCEHKFLEVYLKINFHE